MKPLTEKQLYAIEQSKTNQLVDRLVLTARNALEQVHTLQVQLQESQHEDDQLETARPDRETTVLMIHADGFIELFGEKWIGCKVVHVPEHNSAVAGTVEEKILEALPIACREMVWANKVRGTGNVRCCPTMDGLLKANATRRVIDAAEQLEALANRLSGS